MQCETMVDFSNANTSASLLLLFILLLTSATLQSRADDILRQGRPLRDGENLTSAGGVFELGFFTPGSGNNSNRRYVGIWYRNFSTSTVLWVANRMSPVTGIDGSLAVLSNGNLAVLDGDNKTLWSANVSLSSTNSAVAQIMDTGNFVLNNSGEILWQSFDDPTDTYLPGMKVGLDLATGRNQLFYSWKSQDDPAMGNFSMGMDPRRSTQIFIWDADKKPRWRSGRWNGQVFIGIQDMVPTYIYGFKLSNFEQEGKMYFYYDAFNSSHRYTLNSDGIEEHMVWEDDANYWYRYWAQPVTECELFNKCGNYSTCTDGTSSPSCTCLKGFVPANETEWNSGVWSGGCRRRTELSCKINSSISDGFWKVGGLKLPDLSDWNSIPSNENACRQSCWTNCSCKAYAFVTGIGCLIWAEDLVDMHAFSSGGNDLYIRLAASELEEKKKVEAAVIIAIVIPVLISLGCIFCLWRFKNRLKVFFKRYKRQGVSSLDDNLRKEGVLDFSLSGTYIREECKDQEFEELKDGKELPLLNFDFIIATTGNFSDSNLIGFGGFGPVYKGMLPGNQEIAVKRLSRSSGQGMEEFKNEVILIAKLQHRNLVRLLGCCIKDEEKLLIYEYMPNRSLDGFLFDSNKKGMLDWNKRYNIIEGVARGLLYLHRDSRLRVIHRDLKASNILLDAEMNPKISDFGMARIFGRDDNETNTKRVVGTYGYMSPEYAMHGLFSVKSDVYSFGVLLLEIISGKKNSTYHHPELSLNLLSYAWRLWNEDNAMELVDSSMVDSCSQSEVLRCIYIGLLCVQDRANDRPTMSSVVIMLESETVLPLVPREPTYAADRTTNETDSSTIDLKDSNDASITVLLGR